MKKSREERQAIKKAVWYPVLLFLFLFLADKLLLIPWVVDNVSSRALDKIFHAPPHTADLGDAPASSPRRLLLNAGSSLSFGFSHSLTSADLAASRYLHPSERKIIAGWRIENIAIPGSTLLTSYVRIESALSDGLRPDLITVELTPGSLNTNTPVFRPETNHALPVSFALSHLCEIPIRHSAGAFFSNIFLIRKYPLRNEQSKQFDSILPFAAALFNPDSAYAARTPYRIGFETAEQEVQSRIQSLITNRVFTNFRADPDLIAYIPAILASAQKRKIPVVFWMPFFHPHSYKQIEHTLTSSGWLSAQKIVQDASVPYIDMNTDKELCDVFVDPVHADFDCYPRQAARLIEKMK